MTQTNNEKFFELFFESSKGEYVKKAHKKKRESFASFFQKNVERIDTCNLKKCKKIQKLSQIF